MQVVTACAKHQITAVIDRAQSVANRCNVRIEPIDRVIDSFHDFVVVQGHGIDRQLGEIVARLWVHDCDSAEFEARILEYAAPNRHVRLPFRKAARLQFGRRIETQRRCRRRVGTCWSQVGDPPGPDRNLDKLRFLGFDRRRLGQ